MSRRTIRACDLMCEVRNWDNSINSVSEQLVNAVLDGRTADAISIANEIKRWTTQRDRQLASLRRVTAAFTVEDITHIRRRAPQLEEQLQALDAIKRSWTVHPRATFRRRPERESA